MILLPEKYQELNLEKEEKLFINSIKNKLEDSSIMLLKINPLGPTSTNSLIMEQGVCFFTMLNIHDVVQLKKMLSTLKMMIQENIDTLSKRLLVHRTFNTESLELNIHLSFMYYLPLLRFVDLEKEGLSEENEKLIKQHFIFKDQLSTMSQSAESIKRSLLGEIEEDGTITGDKVDIFIQMIAPEYTIPLFHAQHEGEIKSEGTGVELQGENYNYDYGANSNSLQVKALRLDTKQINIINAIKPGNQLMLACAGSGKSVLLIAKCFKVCSVHPEEDVLLTCYNKNLNDMYKWRISIAGFRGRKLQCMTFHKLCMSLLDEIGVQYNKGNYEEVFSLTRYYLDDGKIKRRYLAIFIDEVQVFAPEWYELCYDLLKDKEDSNHFFTICGDKSQNVASNVKQGKAPWQGNDRLSNYRGKSIRLETNYRNSIPINEYINHFTEIAKEYAAKYKIELKEDKDQVLRGKAIREGSLPSVVKSNRTELTNDIVKSINSLKNRGIDLEDIAVLMPYMQYKPRKYYLKNWIMNKLDEEQIEYSILAGCDEGRTGYANRQGVNLSTVQSALGLDFKAVILCGINVMGAYKDSRNEQGLMDECVEKKEEFLKCVNELYTGCSRAQDELIVLLDEEENKSIYSKMLKEARMMMSEREV